MNKNVPKNGKNIAISVKFHEIVKLIVQRNIYLEIFYKLGSSFDYYPLPIALEGI